MASFTFEIEGLDELIKALQGFIDEAMPYIKEASDKCAELILARTKDKVPVRTGFLKDHLIFKKAKDTKPGKAMVYSIVTVKKGAEYYIPLELGHSIVSRTDTILGQGKVIGHVKARPFLRPAADESIKDVENIIAEALNKALDNIGGLK